MKHLLSLIFLVLMALTANGQQPSAAPLVIPGEGHIDLNRMGKSVDTDIDISRLSLSELRVLRNVIPAQQGYPFMSAELRSLFDATTWYDDAFMARWDSVEGHWEQYKGQPDTTSYRNDYILHDNALLPICYTPREKAFVERIKAREAELLKLNFTAGEGRRVNTANIINSYQLEAMPDGLGQKLARNGFAIVPADNIQMFHVYERNDYRDFPSFVTTDIYLQLFHLYFDCLLRNVEQNGLFNAVESWCAAMQKAMERRVSVGKSRDEREAAEYCAAYFAIAKALLSGGSPQGVPQRYAAMAADEMDKIEAAADETSDFIDGYSTIKFNYSLFRPRGHYTRSDTLGRYFKAMMWLQSVPFGTDSREQLKRAMMMADVAGGDTEALRLYNRITRPMTFLFGQPDNITILQLRDEMERTGLPLAELYRSKRQMAALRAAVEAIGERQTRIRPKFLRTSRHKINLMPQRYMPDAEVLQEMVDWRSTRSLRGTPRGVDIPAAMGWSAAERILLDEMGENERWNGYGDALGRMKRRMDSIKWDATMASQWMKSLTALGETTSDMPYFMQTDEWQKKSLNAALASWAELKHDAILYAKQPMGAECGGGGPPRPVLKGYVEPNVGFWTKAIGLLDTMERIISEHQLGGDKALTMTRKMREEAEFLLNVSRKELKGMGLLDEEYDQIEYLGARYEYLSLDFLRDPDAWLMGWDDVQGTDRNIALIADVYTANGDNVPADEQGILYEAVGEADEIYVVVEIGGYLYLTRGAVFSYRELKEPLGMPRMTDEEWQKMLKESPRKGVPEWMKDITVPQQKLPDDNQRVFYSTGC